MVHGTIWKGGRSDLHVMVRDEESDKNGYSSCSYIEALEETLLPHYVPGRFFQQDNAKIHVSGRSKDFLESHGIWVIDWPSHSPDMNPIEHVWKAMKEILYKEFPHLVFLTGSEVNVEVFVRALKAAWWMVSRRLIDRLIDSVVDRVAELKRVHGWYTHY
jgi:hypothetical protein